MMVSIGNNQYNSTSSLCTPFLPDIAFSHASSINQFFSSPPPPHVFFVSPRQLPSNAYYYVYGFYLLITLLLPFFPFPPLMTTNSVGPFW